MHGEGVDVFGGLRRTGSAGYSGLTSKILDHVPMN